MDFLRFIVPDDTVTIDMEIMTLKGKHIFKQDKNSSGKAFIPWSEDNKPPSSFLKRVRETQKKASKEFLETVLDQELQPNFGPKCPCTCPKVANMSENQFVQVPKLKIAKEMDRDNTPVTERTMEIQNPSNPEPHHQVGKYPTIQTGVTQKMGKITRLGLSHLTLMRTHNPALLLTPMPVIPLH